MSEPVMYARVESRYAGIHLYPLPTDPADWPPVIDAARAAHGVPEDWSTHPDCGSPTLRTTLGGYAPATGHGWDVAVISGPVHEQLLARATLHDPEVTPS